MMHWNSLSNKGTAVFVLSAAVGMLLDHPQKVRDTHWMAFNRMLAERYHHDGFYSESPAYSAHNLSNVYELADLLHGYSDPPDYQPEEGERIEQLDMFSSGRYPLSLLSLTKMLAPGNRMPIIGDTRYDTEANLLSAEILAARLGGAYAGLLELIQGAPLSKKGGEYALWYRPYDLQAESTVLPLHTEWFPGWHVGVLRGGRDDTALYLNGNEHQWTLQTSHRQQDILSLSYYAYGEELASDRGYFSGSSQQLPDGRSGQVWVKSSLSHNLVVVDEEEQNNTACGSNLELFGTAPGIEIVQASGVNVYPQCREYRRTCAMVTTPKGQTYSVDFFRTKGGRIHQYNFHCNGSPMGMNPTTPSPQTVALGDTWDMWLENPQAIAPQEPTTFTWQFRDVNLDLMLLNVPHRIILADAPGWRVGTPEELEKPSIRQIFAENRAEDGNGTLASQYAAVIAPYKTGNSPLPDARLLADDPHAGVLAIEVKLPDRTDYIISTKDQQERQFGPVTAAAQFAFVSVNDQGVQGYLMNGTELICDNLEISLKEPDTTLKVQSVEESVFHLAEPLQNPQTVVGSYLLAGESPQTGFEIASATENAITVRDYPAITCDEVRILNSAWAHVAP